MLHVTWQSSPALLVVVLLVVPCLVVAAPGLAKPFPDSDHDIVVRGIELRPGVEVDVRVRVFVNEDHPCVGRTHFAVHGGLHAASVWQPLAEALFAHNPAGPPACRIAALDLPGRGGSSLPTGITLGELVLSDQVSVILATLGALADEGLEVRTILAQSQGALLVQMAQHELIARGSSLRDSYGIRRAIFLAPAAPAAVPWHIIESGLGEVLVALFTQVNPPPLGSLIVFDDPTWIGFNFTALCCGIVPSAPTPAEVALAGYNAPEPLDATLEILGLAPFSRPVVDAEVFASVNGTDLFVVGYSEDTTNLSFETEMTYEHLTGDTGGERFVLVVDPEAVHAMHVSNPVLLLESTAAAVRF
jgi:pimeloyl-ACP methyl ester carboxylesterase